MKQLILAALAVILMITLGIEGMRNHLAMGPFFIFVGSCTSIGLTLDIINVVRERIRKSNLRKFGIGR